MKTNHLKTKLLLFLIIGLCLTSCDEEIVCNSFMQNLTSCGTQAWKVTISIMNGNSVTTEINEIWRFNVDSTYTRTTVSGIHDFGYDNSHIWLGSTQTQANIFIYTFSNNNTELEFVAQNTAAVPGSTIRRIKFVKQ